MKKYRILDSNFQFVREIEADGTRTLNNGTVIFYTDSEESLILADGSYGVIYPVDSHPDYLSHPKDAATMIYGCAVTVNKIKSPEIREEDIKALESETKRVERAKSITEAFFNAKRKLSGLKIDLRVLKDKIDKLDIA
jgi:hypothetical protein